MLKSNNFRSVLKIVPLLAVATVAGCATATSKPEKAEVAEPAVAPTKTVMKEVLLDTRTLFAFDSAELTAEGKTRLDELVSKAGGESAGQVTVTGHTDRIGPENYNMNLSERRASSVADYMRQQGVPAASITTYARGETEPVVQCEDQNWDALVACLAPNRRVVVEYPTTVEEEVVIEE